MRRIAGQLRRYGARVSRINFNGGDWFDWRGGGINYRGCHKGLNDWLANFCEQHKVSDLVLFGSARPLHQQAIAVAAGLGIHVHVLEEGYLRPNSVSLEHWHYGQAWCPPASLAECAKRANDTFSGISEQTIQNSFARRAFESIIYWTSATLAAPLYPSFRSHRRFTPVGEAILWMHRLYRRRTEKGLSAQAMCSLGNRDFFLFPLQLDGDAQLLCRSPFASMYAALEQIMHCFARNALLDSALVIKRHPYDPDLGNWRKVIEKLAESLNLEGRVHYVEYADLDALLEACAGVVTVNSTVGGYALRRGKPVHPLGTSIYGVEGLADIRPTAQFWNAPEPPMKGAFATFSAALWSECLVNAGFHGSTGLNLLSERAALRMLHSVP
jgi:capsular polysaccharide export protein